MANFFVLSSWQKTDRTVFSGYCFYGDCFIFQQDGYDEFCKYYGNKVDFLNFGDGRFSIAKKQNESLEARTDDFGQDILYYYCDEDNWAISNSFRDLFYHLNQNKIYLTADFGLMRMGRLKHSLFQSLFTNETYFKEIKVLPIDKVIKINKDNSGKYSVHLNKCNDINLYKSDITDEEVALNLQEYCNLSLRKIKTLQDCFKKIVCDISGGNDSRIILSLLLASGGDRSSIRFASNRNWEKDYKIATLLSKKFNLKINNVGYFSRSVDAEESYNLWKRGNLGTYYPVYFPRHNQTTAVMHFHGAGGGGIRNAYGYDFYEFCDFLQNNLSNSKDLYQVIQKLSSEFERLGINVDEPQALMFHYRNFRSRFHFGRSSFRNLHDFLFTPLYSLNLCRLASYYADKPFNQIYFDLLTLIKPELREIPFDSSDKDFTKINYAYGLKSSNVKLNLNVEPMKVFGDTTFENLNLTQKDFDEQLLQSLMLSDLDKYAKAIIKTGIYSTNEISTVREFLLNNNILNNSRAGVEFSHMVAIGEFIYFNNKNKSLKDGLRKKNLNTFLIENFSSREKSEGNSTICLEMSDNIPKLGFSIKLKEKLNIVGKYRALKTQYKSILISVNENYFEGMIFSKMLNMYYKYLDIDDFGCFDIELILKDSKKNQKNIDKNVDIFFTKWTGNKAYLIVGVM